MSIENLKKALEGQSFTERLAALEDGEFLYNFSATQQEVDDLYWEIRENGSEPPVRKSIEMTDQQIEDVFEEATGCGIYAEDLVWSRDTLDDFVEGRKMMTERGKIEKRTDDTLIVSGVQAMKGEPRKTLFVYKFGEFTASKMQL